MHNTIKRYSNGEITVVWQPRLCCHSGNCVRGLPGVFDLRKSPWVTIDGADSATIVAQVKRCPSGALSIAPAPEPPNDAHEEISR